MSLWEYKAITSGKGGFATPALLESYLNQLGADEWEIIDYRTQPENPLAFAGLARRPTQREWTLEAAAAAAARAEADKLRAEFAAKFQAANNPSSVQVASDAGESGNPTRDDSFRRPRDTDSDQDPYALDDSSSDESEEIPEADQLPTFFEAIRPHMRRNQKGPGYSVGLDYLVKKFELLEDDLVTALLEVGFALPEDEDDRPVYVEYDGDIYWLNVNRRGEVWVNTREKPRPVFRTVKATRITPEEAVPEQQEVQTNNRRDDRETRDNNRDSRRNDNRGRRNEQKQTPAKEEPSSPASSTPSSAPSPSPSPSISAHSEHTKHESPGASQSAASEGAQAKDAAEPVQAEQATQDKPQRELAPLPTGLDLLERVRPMMRRSRGGWSGTISYLARALRRSEAELVEAFGLIGLHVATNPGERSPFVECGPFAYWLNKDGRGGIWINAREARRLRQELKAQQSGESGPQAAPDEGALDPNAESPDGLVPGQTPPADAATSLPPEDLATLAASEAAAAAAAVAVVTEECAPGQSVSVVSVTPVESNLPTVQVAVSELGDLASTENATPQSTKPAEEHETAVDSGPAKRLGKREEGLSLAPAPGTLPLAGMRLLLREFRAGTYSGELCFLAEKLSLSADAVLAILLSTGLKAPDKPRERFVYVEHGSDSFWINRNAKGELWLNAKALKIDPVVAAEADDSSASETESSNDTSAEKKPRRAPRTKKKTAAE